jgi:hypothetical protein
MGSIAHKHFTELFQTAVQRLLKFQWEITANFPNIYNQCKAVCKKLQCKIFKCCDITVYNEDSIQFCNFYSQQRRWEGHVV